MNVIFLDIDGVLHSWLEFNKRDLDGQPKFKKEAIESLNKIIKEIDGKIVISSTWRKTRSIEDFQNLFDSRGIEGEVVGLTEELDTGRGNEIKKWVDDNDVEFFVAIDDDSRSIEEVFEKNYNVLRTNLYRCLDEYDYLYVKRGYELYNKRY